MKTDISKAVRRGTFCMISYACVMIMCNLDWNFFRYEDLTKHEAAIRKCAL